MFVFKYVEQIKFRYQIILLQFLICGWKMYICRSLMYYSLKYHVVLKVERSKNMFVILSFKSRDILQTKSIMSNANI